MSEKRHEQGFCTNCASFHGPRVGCWRSRAYKLRDEEGGLAKTLKIPEPDHEDDADDKCGRTLSATRMLYSAAVKNATTEKYEPTENQGACPIIQKEIYDPEEEDKKEK